MSLLLLCRSMVKVTVDYEEEMKRSIKSDCHFTVNVTRGHEAANAIPVGS